MQPPGSTNTNDTNQQMRSRRFCNGARNKFVTEQLENFLWSECPIDEASWITKGNCSYQQQLHEDLVATKIPEKKFFPGRNSSYKGEVVVEYCPWA